MDIVNNVNIDMLPEDVQEALLDEFNSLQLKDQLIVFSRLIHGFLFKVTCNDLFNISKNTPSKVYSEFLEGVKGRLDEN